MTRFVLSAAVALSCGLPTASAREGPDPAHAKFEARVYKEGDKVLPYRLLVPKGDPPAAGWPLIVRLHGSGERGGDNSAQLEHVAGTSLEDGATCPAFVMVPQCPGGSSWLAVGLNRTPDITGPSRMVVEAVERLREEFRLDDRRIYLGGFSMGGGGHGV